MAVSEQFKIAILHYRARGGRLYRLAIDNGMSPSMLSATLAGVRRANYDERIVRIGACLGLAPEECFDSKTVAGS